VEEIRQHFGVENVPNTFRNKSVMVYPDDGNFELLRSPGIDSKGIDSASLCSQAGGYDNPIPTRFLAPIDHYEIPALIISQLYRWHVASKSMKFTQDLYMIN
jgi:hypothetical protein